MLSYASKHKAEYNSKIEDILSNEIDMSIKKLVNDTTYLDIYKREIFINDWNRLVQNIKEGIDISERAKYYFPEKQFRKITFNNLKIAEILDEYYSIIDTSKVNFYIDFNFLLQNKGDIMFYKELEDSLHYFRSNYTFKLPNIKNEIEEKYKIDIYEMWHWCENAYCANLGSQGFVKEFSAIMPEVLESFSSNDSISSEDISEFQEQFSTIVSLSKQSGELAKEGLLVVRSWVFSEITRFLSENYHIINDEVTPLGVPVKQKDDEEKLIDPGYFLAVLSLILIIPFGYCFWYLMIWIIFRKAEKPNTKSSDDWDRQEYLRSELVILSTIECILLNSVDSEKNTKR